jgi:tRNA(adenine34) deaminase
MQLALEQADIAASHDDVPVGCVIVDNLSGQLLGKGPNRREADQDPTAHAEIVAMRLAALTKGHWRLSDCTLFVTLEPCPMCAGAIINARIPNVVYGAPDLKAGAAASLFSLLTDPRLNHRASVEAGVLADESIARLQAFFRNLRASGQK